MGEQLIFEKSRSGRRAFAQAPLAASVGEIPDELRRDSAPMLPQVSELQVVRHYTRLSQKNFSIDTQFYPLGSCTMKYNPRACNALALLPGLAGRHPLGPVSHGQGFLTCMFELQEMLKAVTGMQAVSLTPMAGAQGELAGVFVPTMSRVAIMIVMKLFARTLRTVPILPRRQCVAAMSGKFRPEPTVMLISKR